MATGLSRREVGGVLAELYRAATGVPRRFHLRSEDLKTIARRKRARGEFFWEVARELEIMHSILMSYPRLSRGGVLGFASIRVAERWPTASDTSIRDILRERSDGDWTDLARNRLRKLHMLNNADLRLEEPIRFTVGQLCRIAQKRRFKENWWLELLSKLTNVSASERLTMFCYENGQFRTFAVTHEHYIRTKWDHLTQEFWAAALKRYELEEFDEEPALSGE
jgi:hypothetical protein